MAIFSIVARKANCGQGDVSWKVLRGNEVRERKREKKKERERKRKREKRKEKNREKLNWRKN